MIAFSRSWILVALLSISAAPAARADDKKDEYRLTITPSYAITPDKRWIGVGYFGYYEGSDNRYEVGYVGLGALYRIEEWAELWLVAENLRTDNHSSPDSNEYRPVVGFKNYFTESGPFTFYNLARLEYRIVDRDAPGTDSDYFRFRDLLGIHFAIGKGVNKPGDWYGLTDAEVFYRFDLQESDEMRLRAGVGVTISEYVRLEFIYYMQFTRAGTGDSFEWTENIYRFNIKVARHKGVLDRLAHSHLDD